MKIVLLSLIVLVGFILPNFTFATTIYDLYPGYGTANRATSLDVTTTGSSRHPGARPTSTSSSTLSNSLIANPSLSARYDRGGTGTDTSSSSLPANTVNTSAYDTVSQESNDIILDYYKNVQKNNDKMTKWNLCALGSNFLIGLSDVFGRIDAYNQSIKEKKQLYQQYDELQRQNRDTLRSPLSVEDMMGLA